MPRLIVPPTAAGQRLDLWLGQALGVPRSQVQRLLKAGQVTVAGQVERPSHKLAAGAQVEVREATRTKFEAQRLDQPVIYQDDDVVVINKPAGLAVHPARADSQRATVVDFIRPLTTDLDPERPGIVHRLDSDTSGVLILARHQAAKEALQKQFHDHQTIKRYVALVIGRPRQAEAVVRLPLGRSTKDPLRRVPTPGGKLAETSYRVTASFPGLSLIEASPKTGRTHQIRAHLAALGHPIAGDRRYGGKTNLSGLHRQFLHAASLELTLPNGQYRHFEAPLPADLSEVLKSLHEAENHGV